MVSTVSSNDFAAFIWNLDLPLNNRKVLTISLWLSLKMLCLTISLWLSLIRFCSTISLWLSLKMLCLTISLWLTIKMWLPIKMLC